MVSVRIFVIKTILIYFRILEWNLSDVQILFQMISKKDHDKNNNFSDSCYQIQELPGKGLGVVATQTIPGRFNDLIAT